MKNHETSRKRRGIHEIKGYGVVLAQVQNVYPVEKESGIYSWGFKYVSGMFEFFSYLTIEEARISRNNFMEALEKYLR